MRAAVCYELGKPLVVEDVQISPPGPGEVRVRVAATAICHSDIHAIRGDWATETPVVAGHESAGVVEEVGEGVTLVEPGDRVVLSLIRSCGRCFYCASGSPELCDYPFRINTESPLRTRGGEVIQLGCRVAGLAEQAMADQSQLVKIGEDVPMDLACLLACGVITGYGAVVNTAQVRPGSTVVVIGTGGVGLNAVQGAVISGAAQIVALDTQAAKLEVARRFGATQALDARDPSTNPAIFEMTEGRGADYVFVTVGSSAAFMQGLELTRRGGSLTVVGMPADGTTVPFPLRGLAGSGHGLNLPPARKRGWWRNTWTHERA
jgi:S-(hydroxymethyl)glutathione dehydrogenase/alcohol dehydrogenase